MIGRKMENLEFECLECGEKISVRKCRETDGYMAYCSDCDEIFDTKHHTNNLIKKEDK